MKRLESSALLALTALIWGVAFVAQSVGMEYIGPFTFSAVRFMVGGLVLIPCMFLIKRFNQEEHVIRPGQVKDGIVGGVQCGLALFLGSSLQQFGLLHTTVGKAGFITALYILIVPLLGLFLGRKVRARVWASVAAAAMGMYLLCITDGFSIGKGDIYAFLGAVAFSFHILIIDRVSPRSSGVFISCIQFFTASLISGMFMLLFEEPAAVRILAAWKPVLYAGVLSCGVAYTLQVVAQKHVEPVVASLLLSLEAVFSLLAGWMILGQGLGGRELAGAALMFAATIQAQLAQLSKVPQPAPAADIGCEAAAGQEGVDRKGSIRQ